MTDVETRQRLTVRAGAARVALAADAVTEVIGFPRLTRMPHGPAALLGVTPLRGLVLPVVSLSALLGDGSATAPTRVVVLRRDPPIGLAVDAIEALKTDGQDKAGAQDGLLRLSDDSGVRGFDLDAALQERFSGFRAARQAAQRDIAPARREAQRQELAFLGFSLAGQAYAVPLEAVAEVMAAPPAMVALPRTEEVLIGVFDLRGALLPVLSLRSLLGLEPRQAQQGDRVIVSRIGEHRLALLVDQVSLILRAAPEAVSPAPSLFNRGAGEARIDAMLRLPQDQGLVSILAPARILADDRVASLLAQATDHKDDAMALTSSTTRRERFLILRLGAETYGLPIAAVDEVARLPQTLTRLPRSPAYVQGVMNLRGKVIPVIDQRRRFAVAGEAEAGGETRRVVVVTLGDLQAGFAVDAASRIVEIAQEDLMPAPELLDDSGQVFDRAARLDRDGEIILLIDPRALLDRAEADLLRDLAARSHVS